MPRKGSAHVEADGCSAGDRPDDDLPGGGTDPIQRDIAAETGAMIAPAGQALGAVGHTTRLRSDHDGYMTHT
jgi:hypothetical protein